MAEIDIPDRCKGCINGEVDPNWRKCPAFYEKNIRRKLIKNGVFNSLPCAESLIPESCRTCPGSSMARWQDCSGIWNASLRAQLETAGLIDNLPCVEFPPTNPAADYISTASQYARADGETGSYRNLEKRGKKSKSRSLGLHENDGNDK